MAVSIGNWNELEMLKSTDFGIYLDGEELGEVLMPLKYVPETAAVGEKVRCFIYYDTADRPIATTENALAAVGSCAFLECVATSKFGAFLNWGLTKDLMVPFREQKDEMVEGQFYLVWLYIDNISSRIVGSSKIDKFLNDTEPAYTGRQQVDLVILSESELGYTAVIDNAHAGLLYKNEVFQKLHVGDKIIGFVKEVREDGKVDLALKLPGYDNLIGDDKIVLEIIKSHGGQMNVNDKSDPEKIYELFKMSKKNWKKVIGNLYRKRKIQFTETGLYVITEGD